MNLYTLLESRFPQDRHATCLEVPGGRDRTWDELAQGSARIAGWLASLGLPQGARVAAPVEKSPEGLMLYLATLRAGLVFLPLNTAYRDSELAYFFGNAIQAGLAVGSRLGLREAVQIHAAGAKLVQARG